MDETGLGSECGVLNLENGLRVHFYDQSRPIAGDRRMVQLFVRIPVRILEAYFSEFEDPSGEYRLFTSYMGYEIDYRHTKSRNFIALSEALALLGSMKEDFLAANLGYLSKPSFPKMFVLKEYHEWKKASSWQAARSKHMEHMEKKEGETE